MIPFPHPTHNKRPYIVQPVLTCYHTYVGCQIKVSATAESYSILSDEEKRTLYDQTGCVDDAMSNLHIR